MLFILFAVGSNASLFPRLFFLLSRNVEPTRERKRRKDFFQTCITKKTLQRKEQNVSEKRRRGGKRAIEETAVKSSNAEESGEARESAGRRGPLEEGDQEGMRTIILFTRQRAAK